MDETRDPNLKLNRNVSGPSRRSESENALDLGILLELDLLGRPPYLMSQVLSCVTNDTGVI